MKPLWIELVNSGVANRFELEDHELIEMNWRLTLYPKLYYNVFQHEIKHNDGEYKPQDFIHDMKSRTPGLFKFMKNHLSAWTQILPFYWSRSKKRFIYDITTIASWLMVVGLGVVIFYLLRWIL